METITGELYSKLQRALRAQPEPAQQSENWFVFVGRVKALHKRTKSDIRAVYHPCPELSSIFCESGSVIVLTGERRAVLRTGEIVSV